MTNEPILLALGLVLLREVVSFFTNRHSKLIDTVALNSQEISELKVEMRNVCEELKSFHAIMEEVDSLRRDFGYCQFRHGKSLIKSNARNNAAEKN